MAPLSSLESAFLPTPLPFQVHQLPLDQVEVSLVPLHLRLCLQPLAVCRRAEDAGRARQTAAAGHLPRHGAVPVAVLLRGWRQMAWPRQRCPVRGGQLRGRHCSASLALRLAWGVSAVRNAAIRVSPPKARQTGGCRAILRASCSRRSPAAPLAVGLRLGSDRLALTSPG